MRWEDERLLEAAEPLGDASEPRHADVRLAVNGDDDVTPRLDAEARERAGPLARDRRKSHRCVGHHVANDHGRPGHALRDEELARALVGSK